MPSEVVIVNGRRMLKVPGGQGVDLGPADQPPPSRRFATAQELSDPNAQFSPTRQREIKMLHMAMNPELAAGAAGILFPEAAPVLMPMAIGGAMSAARDLAEGQRDPLTIAGGVLGHGALNAVPGMLGNVTKSVMTRAPGVVSSAMESVPGKVGMVSKVMNALRGEPQIASAVPQASRVGGELADMTLPSGAKVLSQQGLRELVQHSIDLENSGAAKPTVAAVDQLIARVRGAIQPGKMAASDLLSRTGMQTGSLNAQAQAARTAARTASATQTSTLASRIARLLGMGASETNDALSTEP